MALVSLKDVTISFGGPLLLEAAEWQIEQGERICLIGRNGTGKSTLLRLLHGEIPPDSGTITKITGLRTALLPQEVPLDLAGTVYDVISSGHSHQKVQTVISRMSLDETAECGTLSAGLKRRVLLARVLVSEPDILMLDEPTNHLDADSVEWLEHYIKRYQGAVILITHDRYFLDRVAMRMIELDGNTASMYTGGYSSYLQQKTVEEEQTVRDERKRQALVKQELEWMRGGCKARTTKQKARLQRAEGLVYAPVKEKDQALSIDFGADRLGDQIIEFHDVSKSYGEKVLLKKFEYRIRKGDRIGIIGPNGSGKTTLFEMITGRVQPDSGDIVIGKTVKIGYYDQESRDLDESKRVIEFIRDEAEQIKTKDGTVVSAAKMLERFLFRVRSSITRFLPFRAVSGVAFIFCGY